MTALATHPAAPTITPEAMLTLPEARHAELVDGTLLEKPGMSRESSLVTTQLIGLMFIFLREHPIGRLMETQATYQCFEHKPKQVRRPDVSFVLHDHLAPDSFRGNIRQPPDLVAEIVSLHDTFSDIQHRVDDFRRADVPLIWVIDPLNRQAQAYRGNEVRLITADGELDGDPVLPGFRCPMPELFKGLPEPMWDDIDTQPTD